MNVNDASVGVVIAALIAALLAPWFKGWLERRSKTQREADTAKRTLAAATHQEIERIFSEYDKLREAYRSDLDDVRNQLSDARTQRSELVRRIAVLEQEVAEWRAGVRGVVGVWVAVPAHIWDYVRQSLPDLPSTRFPGETEAITAAEYEPEPPPEPTT